MNTENDQTEFYGLPLFKIGLTMGELDLSGGVVFWDEVIRFTSQASLEEVLDQATAGKPVPRVWTILDVAAETSTRTAAVMSLARLLATRDQQVIVLDADDYRPDLSRWAGRAQQEGWIDLLRYGASMTTCSVPLPWEGRRGQFIGVGSFCPTEVEPDEVEQLVSRLRRQTDDLIIAAPANDAGLVWARHASICMLCWNRLDRTEGEMQEVIATLESAGVKVAGIVGFGFDEVEILESVARLDPVAARPDSDDEELGEEPPDEELPDDGREAATAVSTGEETAAAELDWVARAEPAAEPEKAPATEPEKAPVTESEKAPVTEPEKAPGGENELAGYPDLNWSRPQRRRTSPVFWGLALVLIAVVVVIGGWWLKMEFFQPDARDHSLASLSTGPDIGRLTKDEPAGTDPESPGEPAGVDAGEISGEAPGETPGEVPEVPGETQRAAAGELLPVTPDETSGEAVGETLKGAGTIETVPPPQAAVRDRELDRDQAQTADIVGDREQTPESFDMAPYRTAVGAAGWALHLYSLPDSATALKQTAWLQRKGFRADMRGVDLPDKGHWYRVFVGSFPSQREARLAMPALKEHLRLDWAMPKRF